MSTGSPRPRSEREGLLPKDSIGEAADLGKMGRSTQFMMNKGGVCLVLGLFTNTRWFRNPNPKTLGLMIGF